jgi:hypothetical protein
VQGVASFNKLDLFAAAAAAAAAFVPVNVPLQISPQNVVAVPVSSAAAHEAAYHGVPLTTMEDAQQVRAVLHTKQGHPSVVAGLLV